MPATAAETRVHTNRQTELAVEATESMRKTRGVVKPEDEREEQTELIESMLAHARAPKAVPN